MDDTSLNDAETQDQEKPSELAGLYRKWTAEDGKYNVHECLRHFFSDPSGLLLMLRSTRSLIAGDVPTQLLRDEFKVLANPKMDIMVHGTLINTEYRERVVKFFLAEGYEPSESLGQAPSNPTPQSPLLGREKSLVRGDKKVHIRTVECFDPLMDLPHHYSTTASMNAITGTHVVSFFPKLTFADKLMYVRPASSQRRIEEEQTMRRGWGVVDQIDDLEDRLTQEENETKVMSLPEARADFVSGRVQKALLIGDEGQLQWPSEKGFEAFRYWFNLSS
ncbi:hypothetical protein PG985_016058 [Apiospora marii]|uniref:DNA2/NAM7 helicase helicase domain-containing protein n=1 Tax=Apiospora marii TaxID=335849 RepID=A0ABR1S3M8_9PEZI